MNRLLAFAWEEAVSSLRVAGRTAALSVWTIAVAFIVTGVFLVAIRATRDVVDAWARGAELSVYLQDATGDAERQMIAARLTRSEVVESHELVSKDEALARFLRSFPDLRDVTASLGGNPFPASFEVRVRTGTPSALTDALVASLRPLPGVDEVRYERALVQRLLTGVRAARIAAVVVTLTLLLGAALTVASVVRLSMQARRDDMHIMALVGAPISYIRGPYVLEGALLGGAGACTGLLVLFLGLGALAGALPDGAFVRPSWMESLGLVLLGVTVGAGAGAAATSGWHDVARERR